jgi:hypothetical protein
MGDELFGYNCYAMPVAIELQNLGDAQSCREIAASIEQALGDKRGESRVSIAGLRAGCELKGSTALSGRMLWRVLPGSINLRQLVD